MTALITVTACLACGFCMGLLLQSGELPFQSVDTPLGFFHRVKGTAKANQPPCQGRSLLSQVGSQFLDLTLVGRR